MSGMCTPYVLHIAYAREKDGWLSFQMLNQNNLASLQTDETSLTIIL